LKKLISLLTIALAIVLATGTALANEASFCGATHGAFASENGNFGWLGELGGTPGYHDAVGQNQPATGYNNSHACSKNPNW